MNPVQSLQKSLQERKSGSKRKRWQTAFLWTSSVALAVILLLFVAATIALHSAAFHNYVLKKASAAASESLGTRVELQNFALHFSKLSLDLYGLTVYGAQPYPEPPLLQVQQARVGIGIVSVLHRQWYLDTVQIDNPVVRVFSDANGNSNIPKPKSSSDSHTSVFDLGIRHAALINGQAYYNDKHSAIAADLHDLEFRAGFTPAQQKYTGILSYTNGHLEAGAVRSFPHDFRATFEATPSSFHLQQATLASGASHLELSATLQNYSDPDVQAQYDAVVDGRDVRTILSNSSVPTGVVHASGTLTYRAIANQPVLNAVLLSGTLDSRQLNVETGTMGTRVYDISAQYSLAHGDATVQAMHARLLGGVVDASAKMSDLTGNSHSEASASLRGISLADLRAMLRTTAVPKDVALNGTLNGQLKAAWGQTLKDLVAGADASVDGRIAGNINGAATVVPIQAGIHGNYVNASEELSLARTTIRTPQTSLSMNGVMSNHSRLVLQLHAGDLREVETIADLFRSPASAQPLGLAGTASFNGTLAGSLSTPHLTGQLNAANLRVHGTSWRTMHSGVDISPSLAKLENAVLEPASQGRIALSASAGLAKWSFTNTSPVQVNMTASQINVTDLTKAIGEQLPVTGVLGLNVNIHGTELHPVGQGSLSLSRLTAYNEPFRSAQLNFSGTGDEVHGNLTVSSAAGTLQSQMSVQPQQRSFTADVSANDVRLEKLAILKSRSLDANGGVSLHATGSGTFDNPQVNASVQIPQLLIQKQTIRGLDLQMNVANHVGSASLTSQAIGTSIRANAKVNLVGDYQADATLDTQAIPLQPLAAIYAPDQAASVSGQTELHASLHGPLKDKQKLEAHVTVPMLMVGYGNNIQLAASSPIHVDYKDTVISVQRSAIRGTGTDLQFQGTIPTTGNSPMSLLLLGTVNLQLVQLVDPDLTTSGELKFDINSYGATRDPNVQGQIQIVNAGLATTDVPVGLQHGNGTLTLTRDRLNITQFQGTVGSGTLTAQGGIVYRPGMQFDLGVSANNVRVLYPQGVREDVNANIRLMGSPDNAILGGAVDLADISFTPAFDLNNFISQFSGGVTPPPTQGIAQNIQLNLNVHSSNNINLVSRTLSLNGTANLQVRGTAAQPVILGRINLDSGDLIFNGDRFVLNGGTIQFVNPTQTEPIVNLALNTNIQQYSIDLRFTGPVDQLHTEYASDPSLPAADIINLLAFGQTTEANSANPPTPANQQAESLVASQVSSEVTSRISKVAGISQLSINPVLAGGTSQGPPGADITIQQRVTGSMFVTFSSNVATTQNERISGQYQVTPRFAVSATRDQNGGFAVDTTIKKSW